MLSEMDGGRSGVGKDGLSDRIKLESPPKWKVPNSTKLFKQILNIDNDKQRCYEYAQGEGRNWRRMSRRTEIGKIERDFFSSGHFCQRLAATQKTFEA